ncbi:acyl-coenzyme A synthetase/AMP-(fatty) acid ligase/3-hydroxymyristoyl/3-hydroxydecanoyl-(acyl carrier protein) dehydratase [Neisseria sp. HSC-16F19]|nr:AMP-binding protein [Neisseria sp. HSC-16F19]MCP2040751.1 acyl-coenzyme A synthetase/AMP-(fatty) acid ligase/3-hydroxymyristoyl/3-hydroxydecanoyl-(acyl carrier protein) dehydratase [Neisseria sp. HSC-16F19]
MHPLSEILSPRLPPGDLIACGPDWTRGDFNRAVLRLSGSLRAQSWRTAALWFDDAAEFACAVLAAWHAGLTVLLPPNLAAENLAWADETADVWLTDSPEHPALSARQSDTPLWTRHTAAEAAENDADFLIPLSARACLKTSGSSGQAVVVTKTMAQMQAEALALAATVPFQAAAVAGSVSPQHLYGFTFRFALALTLGWTMLRPQYLYPETLLEASRHHRQLVWIASPALLNRLGEERNWAAVQPQLAGIISSGGALPAATADLLARHAVRPFEIYGSTETGVIAHRQNSGPWQPVAGVENGCDADGALWVASPWSDGRVQTADVVEREGSGFTLIGRKDRIIKFEDKRVSLTRIEHDLLAHPWVADAHCGLHPQHRRLAVWAALSNEGLAALCEQGRAAVIAELKQHLAAANDVIALPRFWRFTDALPRNAQAKIAAADFQAALTQPQTEPQWQPAEERDDKLYFHGRVPVDLVYFGGHFANFPLVPGVIELQWVYRLAARFDWGRQSLLRVENLKFQQFVRPGDDITVELAYDAAKNKLLFKLSKAEGVCASGRMVYGAHGSV